MTKSDGGAAFPQSAIDNQGRIDYADQMGFGGMTLRQWYAGMAMQGILAHPNALGKCAQKLGESVYESLAPMAFECADAMIAHEEKERKS